MYTIEAFKKNFISELQKKFKQVVVKDDSIIITKDKFEVNIAFESIFLEYKAKEDFENVVIEYIKMINSAISENTFELDYCNVYPIIKNTKFGSNEKNIDFVKERFTLDLDIYFALDQGNSFKFILQDDNVDTEILKENALKNLNKIAIPLEKLGDDFEIYALKFNSDFAASLLLSNNIRKQIDKKIGRNFLFCIPSASGLLVAKNRPDYVDILKQIMKVDEDPNRISERVYRYNGKYGYADLE